MNNIFKIFIAAYTTCLSSFALASFPPPDHCKEGAVYEGGVYGGKYNYEEGTVSISFSDLEVDYLAAVVKKHILRDHSHRVKADGAYFFSRDDTVKFYDSAHSDGYNGYRGKDKTNFEGNAYLSYKFDGFNRGPGWVWVKKSGKSSNGEWCSKQRIYLQDKPDITYRNIDIDYEASGRANVTAVVEGKYDIYSQKGMAGTPVTVTWDARTLCSTNGGSYKCPGVNDQAMWESLKTTYSGESFFTSLVSGQHELKATINDGNYERIYIFLVNEYSDGNSGSGSGGSSGGGFGGSCNSSGICSQEP